MPSDPIQRNQRFAILGGALLVRVALTGLVSGWSWFWTTFPVNDTVGARWSDADWQQASSVALWRGALRALVVALLIAWINAGVRRRIGIPSRRSGLAIALLGGAIVLCVSWYASRSFLAVRPLW